jgi:hypothetical protein
VLLVNNERFMVPEALFHPSGTQCCITVPAVSIFQAPRPLPPVPRPTMPAACLALPLPLTIKTPPACVCRLPVTRSPLPCSTPARSCFCH